MKQHHSYSSPSRINRQFFATIVLALIGDTVDFFESREYFLHRPILRGFLDTGGHLIIGVLSWIIIDPHLVDTTDLIIVAFGSSVFIDIDHFISARTISLRGAMKALYRGPFHCTLLLSGVNLILFVIKPHLALLFLISFVPHHIRDAGRRGIFLYPPNISTSPIPLNFVRLFILIFPWVIYYLRQNYLIQFGNWKQVQINTSDMKSTNQQYIV